MKRTILIMLGVSCMFLVIINVLALYCDTLIVRSILVTIAAISYGFYARSVEVTIDRHLRLRSEREETRVRQEKEIDIRTKISSEIIDKVMNPVSNGINSAVLRSVSETLYTAYSSANTTTSFVTYIINISNTPTNKLYYESICYLHETKYVIVTSDDGIELLNKAIEYCIDKYIK